jgi:hypothetical protein
VFEVKQYSQKDGNIALSLLKGSLRAITGLVAERNPTLYHMDTVVATIGIRGTSFQATFCAQSCNIPDGLYVTGGDGTTFVRNAYGEIDLSRGRTAYVPSPQSPPRETNVKPVAGVAAPVSSQVMASAGATNPSELRPGNFVYFQGTPTPAPLTFVPVTSGGGGLAASGVGGITATVILRGTSQVVPDSVTGSNIGAGAGVIGAGQQITVAFDSAQRPVSITALDGLGNRGSVTALSVPELAFNDGILYWGRWTNSKFSVDVQVPTENSNGFGTVNVPAGSFLHYIIGSPAASVPLAGSATYSFIGGTGSTSVAGTVGDGITAGSLSANFATNRVGANLTISHGGTYSASGTADIGAGKPSSLVTVSGLPISILGNRGQFTSFSGSATGPTGSAPFRFEGFFAGAPSPTAPARAGIVWEISRPDPIVGAGAFRCSSGC